MSEQDDFQLLQLRVSRLERELSELRASLAATRRIAQAEPMFQTPAIAPVQPEIAPPPPPLPNMRPLVLTSLSTPPPPQISLENRLGSQIFNRIAIVALLIGTAYGLKLAIDNGLLGPVARVLIGLVAGAGLVLWSERFRRQGVLAFSYSLKAVGSGVLYLSLWAAFQLFHLLPSWAALAAMILVTAWNAFMAWSQDAELLAAYALLGGFLTPVLLSTGGNHEIFVFTYILTIDAATVALIRVKHWPRLLLGTFPATVLYFIGWYSNWYVASELALTAVFLVLFWAVFIAASLGHEEPSTAKASPLQTILLPLASAAFLALGLYSVLQDAHHHDWLAWLMLALAAIYLGLMQLPQRRTVSAVHLSLAVVFLTIAIPLKASGRWITVAWLVEGVALFWVVTRLGSREADHTVSHETSVLRWLASGALALGFAGVFASNYWFSSWIPGEFFQKDVGTALVGIAAFAGVARLAYGQSAPHSRREMFAAMIAADVLALLLCVREVALPR